MSKEIDRIHWGADDLTRLCDTCAKLANIVIKKGEAGEPFCEEMKIGYLALSGYLLKGVSAISEMRIKCAELQSSLNIARECISDLRDISEELLGDSDIDSWSKKDYEQLKDYCTNSGVQKYASQLDCGYGDDT